jgi:hypothetical protein
MTKDKSEETEDGFFKWLWRDFSGSLILEILWNILMFIPRIIIRFISNIW